MEIYILLAVAIVTSYISSGIINVKRVNAATGVINKAKSAFPNSKWTIIYTIAMLAYQIGLCFVLVNRFEDNLCNFVKVVVVCSLMWPMAFIDIKQKRIPNKLVVLGLIYRVIILVFEIIFFRKGLLRQVVSELLIFAVISVVIIVGMVIIKNGIGMGDLKLLMMMSLLLGTYRMTNSIMLSMIIAFFVALYLLIVLKKDKKYDFAFGPIIAVGTLISNMIFG